MLKNFAFKKIGFLPLDNTHITPEILSNKEFIKVLLLAHGGNIIIDFEEYEAENDSLFFVSPTQHLKTPLPIKGFLVYYNRDFYCIEIHDKEVSCDGILFNNVYETPVIPLPIKEAESFKTLFQEIAFEIHNEDIASEEMIRILLKTIIIKALRFWKVAHHLETHIKNPEVEFLRKLSRLIESNYKKLHTVAEYADLLHITSKNLQKKVSQLSQQSPNDLIKQRIILEAKRLLAHTTLTVKEIAYELGYEDPAYFIRLFTKQTALSPMDFRKNYT